MEIKKTENPQYDWDIRVDRTLQHPVRIVASSKNVEIREYISNILRDAVSKEKVGV